MITHQHRMTSLNATTLEFIRTWEPAQEWRPLEAAPAPQSPPGRRSATRSLSHLDISGQISEMNPEDSGKFGIWLFHASFTVSDGCGCSWPKVTKKEKKKVKRRRHYTVNWRTKQCDEPGRVLGRTNVSRLHVDDVTSGHQVNCVGLHLASKWDKQTPEQVSFPPKAISNSNSTATSQSDLQTTSRTPTVQH